TCPLSTRDWRVRYTVESGQVDTLRHEGEIAYRKCRRAVHHHHLVCRNCGLTVELQGDVVEKWAQDLAAANGFVQVEHTLEFVGLCEECAAEDAP
ncbi:MAG: Fur family transcriptional regulator, partial [Actinomycetota bacterium]